MTTLVSADGAFQWNGRRWKAVTNAQGEISPWSQDEIRSVTQLNRSPGYEAPHILTESEEAALQDAFAETSFFQSVATPVETTPLLAGAGATAGAASTIPGGSSVLLGAGGAGVLTIGAAILGGTLGSGSGTEKNPDRSKGYTLPGHHFVGPGNDADDEDAIDVDDAIAKKHDHAYQHAQTAEHIRTADEVAIQEFHDDYQKTGNIHSLIGRVGLQIKHAAEGRVGVKYPSVSGKEMSKYRWKFDPDNWPDQRVNWDGMSRSQKAYTIKQYNKARRAKGIGVVPNPFDKNENRSQGHAIFANEDGTETITPRTGRDPILDIGGKASAPKGYGPIINILNKQKVQQAEDRQMEADWLEDYFKSPIGAAYLDSLSERNNVAELAQFSGSQAPTRQLPPADDLGVPGPSNGRGQKRPQEDGQGQAERPIQPTTETTMAGGDRANRQPTAQPMDTGAAPAPAAAASGHSAKADGGFDSAQGPEGYIPQGSYDHGGGHMSFTKVHQIKSYALPFLNLVDDNEKLTTTPLGELPWDRPLFYMSKGEFDLIPAGSRFTKCSISVHNIVSSTQYPTGSAEASTATFNHPKIGVIGFDLARKCRGGVTKKYTMSTTKEMAVTAVGPPDYDEFIKKQYGTDQSSATWDTDDLPGTMFPIPFNLYNYFTVVQPNKATATSLGFTSANAPGYENFNADITQFNLNDLTWDKVFEREYAFTSAPIGQPFKHLESVVAPINQGVGNHVFANIRRTVTNTGPAQDLTITESFVPSKESGIKLCTYKGLIEQGANLSVGDAPHKPSRQPTVHFGMKAIPKLSSLTNETRASEFVHSEVYYIVRSTIHVKTNSFPNRYIQPKTFNVPIEGALTGSGFTGIDGRLVTFNLNNDEAV